MTETIVLSLAESEPSGELSPETERLVDHAFELAERTGASVHALYVVDTGRYGEPALSSAEIIVDDVEDAAYDLLTTVAGTGRQRGVTVTTDCVHGRPNDELPAYATEIDADTVFIARRCPGRVRTELETVADSVVTPGMTTEE